MACDLMRPNGITVEQRKKQVETALDRLNKALAIGEVKIAIDKRTGSLTFAGTWERVGISDACAFRKLQAAGSPALRQALARAEVLAGRKIDPRALASGVHSHDGGNTWHKGH